ncbi:MAG: hypothetical protein KAX51_04540 [Chromatiaceae bacterium]|nr:hypothetical protein [Chromatiaceae bacterium]MBP6807583.1 hypothetical protein [Chromatiaceae bacterium]MBP8289065.1 hypothetical protein [Chromatiaceae bacterium]
MAYLRTTPSGMEYPYPLTKIRRDCPQTSFPQPLAPERLEDFGVHWVPDDPPPAHDAVTQTLEELPPALLDGAWSRQWQVMEAAPEAMAQRLALRRADMRVSPRQARLALRQAGLLGTVTAWIAQADEVTRIEWESATEIRRDWPPIAQCGAALGLAAAQLDGLFALAATL